MSTELSTSTVFISRSDNGRLFYVRDAATENFEFSAKYPRCQELAPIHRSCVVV